MPRPRRRAALLWVWNKDVVEACEVQLGASGAPRTTRERNAINAALYGAVLIADACTTLLRAGASPRAIAWRGDHLGLEWSTIPDVRCPSIWIEPTGHTWAVAGHEPPTRHALPFGLARLSPTAAVTAWLEAAARALGRELPDPPLSVPARRALIDRLYTEAPCLGLEYLRAPQTEGDAQADALERAILEMTWRLRNLSITSAEDGLRFGEGLVTLNVSLGVSAEAIRSGLGALRSAF